MILVKYLQAFLLQSGSGKFWEQAKRLVFSIMQNLTYAILIDSLAITEQPLILFNDFVDQIDLHFFFTLLHKKATFGQAVLSELYWSRIVGPLNPISFTSLQGADLANGF